MKKISLTFLAVVFAMFSVVAQDSVLGKWKTIDDETGEAKSIVSIYEKGGKLYGKIDEILNSDRRDAVCDKCSGDLKNKPILGMVILKDLKKDGSSYSGGTILDPQKGKSYKCTISLENPDLLKVRGYIGFSLIGRSQYWHRVK